MISDHPFECPVCSGFQYKSLATPERNVKGHTYVCTCCGFTFCNPKSYRPIITAYPMLQLSQQQKSHRETEQGLIAMMVL